MLRNYVTIALRLIAKNKVFSLINIAGLATGIACCILIALYVQDEFSYEKAFPDRERIFRINTTFVMEGFNGTSGFTSPPIATDLKAILPEVEVATRVVRPFNVEQHIIRYGDKTFFEKSTFIVDSTFFKVFPYDLVHGDEATALNGPSAVVLAADLSKRIFGDANPLDEFLIINSGQSTDTFRVTGVVAKPEFPSHVDAQFYTSMNSNGVGRWVMSQTTWANNNMVGSYLKFGATPNIVDVERKMARELEARAGAELKQSGRQKILTLENLDDIRLYSAASNDSSDYAGSITYVYIIGTIGLVILLLACINFMNLTTARSAQRAGEVGIRKSMGAFRTNLVRQFLGESMVIVFFALIAAFFLVALALPSFNDIIQKQLAFTSNNLPFMVGAAILIGLATGVLAGSYPAFFLSSMKPTQVLKSKGITGGAQWLRKGLVVFQFVITITLISSIVIIRQQLSFIQSKSLGFDTEQMIMIPMRTGQASAQYETLKNTFAQIGGVNQVSGASSVPSTPLNRDWLLYKQGASPDQTIQHDIVSVDVDYFKTLGVELIAGRDFIVGQDNVPADTVSPMKVILNEASLKAFQLSAEDAVGSTIYFNAGDEQYDFEVVGIAKDFHHFSLHREIQPMLFYLPGSRNSFPYLTASINMASYASINAEMKKIWEQRIHDAPFETIFLNDNLKNMYVAESRTSAMLTISTTIALIISCLGLYGLSVFVAERKTKEIGIRKVVGASVESIVGMLSREYIRLIFIAFLIAIPLGYWGMNKWLEAFAYRIEPGVFVFAVSGLAAFLIAWLTISFESFRAARKNPVDTFRTN